MTQETSSGDMLFGVVVLIIFMIFVFALGFAINSFKNRRFTRAWAPLVPLIGGKVVEDGGGAASSWLIGTYRDQQVAAQMTPNRNLYSGETGHDYNHFDVALRNVPGKQDWSVEYKTAILGFGQTGWQIEAEDPALQQRLHASGILDHITRMGGMSVTYRKSERLLRYSEDITPLWISPPERFQQELEFLLLLKRINEQTNM